MSVYSTDEILALEACEIHKTKDLERLKLSSEISQNVVDVKNCDDRKRLSVEKKGDLYREFNAIDRTALCLSGGGIRSAAFSLGAIQAFALHPRPADVPVGPPSNLKGGKAAVRKDETNQSVAQRPEQDPEACFLAQFHYLSTVSGGGYCGSFLSAWRHRCNFAEIHGALTSRPDGADEEPKPLAWLRAYSNYLSPEVGLMSADTWAGVAIALRNLLLNWLVILPVLCTILLALKLLSLISIGLAHSVYTHQDQPWWITPLFIGLVLTGALCLGYAVSYATRHRPTWQPLPPTADRAPRTGPYETCNVRQSQVLWHYLLPSVLSAMALTQFAASNYGLQVLATLSREALVTLSGAAGGLVYAAAWVVARDVSRDRDPEQVLDAVGPKDMLFWSLSGVVYGVLAGLGMSLYAEAPAEGSWWLFNDLLLPLIFGVPFFLAAQVVAEMIFIGLSSYEKNSDSDREWFGRSSGWTLVTLVGWIAVVFLCFTGSYVMQDIEGQLPVWLASVGGTTGIVTGIVGGSSLSSVTGGKVGRWPMTTATLLAIAAPLFAAMLIVFLSAGLDAALLDAPLVLNLRQPERAIFDPAWCIMAAWIFAAFVLALLVSLAASWSININRFSLHAVYRNRLIRTFLGASNPSRRQDAFTGFDITDNPDMHALWPKAGEVDKLPGWRPFHVVNCALNIVSTKRLAWQQRKAESFTVSPLHSGSACKAYRSSEHYGHPTQGISLGTAMAISGAAASPNMGYNSSPAVTFLLALFNVRLGWWLGNPGREGDATYKDPGPKTAIVPFLKEVFGWTTDDQPYVYLSDGGHFENLGLYEMVRRRCRSIVLVDAGADPKFVFEDVGNAVRKIQLDLGVRVEFHNLDTLATRKPDGAVMRDAPYHALATIHYKEADPKAMDGVLLYLKPACHGTESAGIRSYAAANPDFPHQGTGDQFFDEPQFESYRALGFETADRIVSEALGGRTGTAAPTLQGLLREMMSSRAGAKRLISQLPRTPRGPGGAPGSALA